MFSSTQASDGQRGWAAELARSLVDANPAPIIAMSPSGVIIHCNSAAAALSGVTAAELIGRDFTSSLIDPDIALAALADVLRIGSVTDLPLRIRQESGTEIDVLCSASVYRDEHGDIVGILAAARDVTAEREAQRVLGDQRDRLQLVLGSARLGVWDWNMLTDEGVVDARFAEILGYTLEDFTPTSNSQWLRMTHPDDVQVDEEYTQRHVTGIDEYYDVETRMRHRDGSWIWVRDRGRIVEWTEDGRPLRMTGTLEDVTNARSNADRLVAAEEQFRLAMDQSTIGMCLVQPSGQFIRVNPALCGIFARTAADLVERTWQELTHPDDLELDLSLVEQVLSGELAGYRLLKRYLRPDGEIVWGDLSVALVRESSGEPSYFISQIVDVTDRQAAEFQLAEREELLRVVLDNSPDPTVRFDADLRIEYINQVTVESSGIPLEVWIGKTFVEMGFDPDLTARWVEHGNRVFATGERESFEFTIDSVRGERFSEATFAPELAPDGTVAHVVGTIHDLTRRRRAEEELLRLATHDALTGLPNRALLGDELERAMQSAARLGGVTAVLMVDLDRFKNINDSLGHGAGDELLRTAAARMLAVVRGGDLVARTGGDEFVVVMREVADTDEALALATRIVETFRSPFTIDHQDVYTTASVGLSVALVPRPSDDLVRDADTAMYVAKADGRDRVVVYNHQLRAAVSSRLAIESDLRQAIDREEIDVWYQPEVDLITGDVTAVEALLRWKNATGSMRNAESFIEIAEETGLIVPLGDWVLHRACRDAAGWARRRGQSAVVVRVNVSARQLAEPGLVDAIADALAKSGLEPRLLCVEITETALLSSSIQAHANIEGARALGVSVALDDFGTGYASLAYLREYPIDMLKIDRSFITRVTSVEFDRKLVAGILALAAQLGLDVTAEGVEHEGQARCLRELGCRGVQGFLFSEAVPADQVPAMLAAGFATN